MAEHASSMQASIADEVNKRLTNAVDDLRNKYANGGEIQEFSESGPTGTEYMKAAKTAANQKKLNDRIMEGERQSHEEQENERKLNERLDNDDVDDYIDDDLELRLLRDKRLKEIRAREVERLDNLSKGHGEYREIVEDEFLNEVTGSERVVCHFYHRDFERCKIMDHHLTKLSEKHVETKFIKLNAEKAPFFVNKLTIRTMPTLAQFIDGVCRGKLIGFEGLSDNMPEGREDEWKTHMLANILKNNTMIDTIAVYDDEAARANAQQSMEEMRSAYINNTNMDWDDLDLDEDD